MPFISITTSASFDCDERQRALLSEVTQLVAEHLGKPTSYVMVHLAAGEAMALAGSNEPCAHIAVHGIGTPTPVQTQALVAGLGRALEARAEVPSSRTFVVFTPVPRELWGLDGRMLG